MWCLKQIALISLYVISSCESGKIKKFGIVGGEETSISNFPYQVAYLVSGKLKCGASIISSNCVLTAGHCVNNFKTNVTVRVGSSHKERDGTVHAVKQIINHPSFNPVKLYNDIAILVLQDDIMFDATTKPIALPMKNQVIPDGTMCTVSGWDVKCEALMQAHAGKMDKDLKPDILRSVDVKMVNREVCQQSYNTTHVKFKITEEMVCAGYLEGGRDACTGDSGGPLTCVINGKRIQAGVVSSGYGCALQGFPGIYSEVAKFRDWIEEKCVLPKS